MGFLYSIFGGMEGGGGPGLAIVQGNSVPLIRPMVAEATSPSMRRRIGALYCPQGRRWWRKQIEEVDVSLQLHIYFIEDYEFASVCFQFLFVLAGRVLFSEKKS